MIHSNELRIGNYLEYYNPTDDLGWQTTQADWQDIRLCHEQNESFNLENRPIPLTEEWLLKFGFYDRKFYLDKGFFFLTKGGEKEYLYQAHTKRFQVKYVHQLQTLYFALTGEEL